MAPSAKTTAHLIAAAISALTPTASLANPHPQGEGYTVVNAAGSTQVILPTTTIAGAGLTPPLVSVPTGLPSPSMGGTIDEGTMIVTLPVESYGTPFNPLPGPSGTESESLGSVPPVPLPSPVPTTESGVGLPGLSSSGGGMSPTPSGSASTSGTSSGSGAGATTTPTPTPPAAPAGAPAMVQGVVGAGVVAGIAGLLML